MIGLQIKEEINMKNKKLKDLPVGMTLQDKYGLGEYKQPDARKYQKISFIKSGIRLLGYILLPFDLGIAMGVLIISEIIGIFEELV